MVEQEITPSLRSAIGETLLWKHQNAIEVDMIDELVEILGGRPDGYTHDIGFQRWMSHET